MGLDFRFDLPETQTDPVAVYRRFREAEPVYWSERYQAWFLFRYADVSEALRNPKLSEKRIEAFRRLIPPDQLDVTAPALATLERWVLFQAGEDHRRQRRLFSHGFMPRAIQELEPRLHEVAAELLDRLRGRSEFDAATEYAIPFPVTVIAELFGLPPEERPRVARWSDEIAFFLTSIPIPAEACVRIVPVLNELTATMERVVQDRRAHPRGEFLDELIQAEEGGQVIESADLMANLAFVLFAGNETTRNLIGNGLQLLLDSPAAWAELSADPKLWENAIHEILRCRSSVQLISRLAVADVTFGGKTIRAGHQVFCLLGSANHDPEVFPEPERFDIHRTNASDHLAFGAGAHFCLGHYLAHAEGRVALSRLRGAFPGLRRNPERPPELLRDARLMGYTRFPVLA